VEETRTKQSICGTTLRKVSNTSGLRTRDHINALVGACDGMGNGALIDKYEVKENGCIYSLVLP
jgi:hypothetical protein